MSSVGKRVSGAGCGFWLGVGGLALLVVVSSLAVAAGLWKLLVVGWVSFGAMAGGAFVGARTPGSVRGLVWGYGLSSGAMISSACAFLLPLAFGLDARIGGFGIAAGILGGFCLHAGYSAHSRLDSSMETVTRLTAHALAAGLAIGTVYATLPQLGLLLGLGIVSHKGPAGYAAARQMFHAGRPVWVLLVPAVGVGVPAILVGLLQPQVSHAVDALLFGFGAGLFLHVAVDFLPKGGAGGVLGGGFPEDAHAPHGGLRFHAVASTLLGGLLVFAAWAVVAL